MIGGLLLAGNLGDGLIRRGRLDGRILLGCLGFTAAGLLLAPGILSTSLLISSPLFILAGVAVSAPNPGLDAARLDVVPASAWGRAEAVRTMLRRSLEAFAPLTFGLLAEVFGGSQSGLGSGVNVSKTHPSPGQTHGLQVAFLIMLTPVVIGGILLLLARRTYPTDAASAHESDRRFGLDETDIDGRHIGQMSPSDA